MGRHCARGVLGGEVGAAHCLQLLHRSPYPHVRYESVGVYFRMVYLEILHLHPALDERPQLHVGNDVAHVGNGVAHLRQRVVWLDKEDVVNTEVEGKTQRHIAHTHLGACSF